MKSDGISTTCFFLDVAAEAMGRLAIMARGPKFLSIGAAQHVDDLGVA